MSSINLKLAVPAVALVIAIGGYFGLSSYAGNKAEKAIHNYLYDNRMENTVSWKSVSSSPFGGTITLKQVEIDHKNPFPVELKIDKIVIQDYKNDDNHTKARIELSQISPIDPDSEFGKFLRQNLYGAPLIASGQTHLEPQTIKASFDYRNDKSTLAASLELDAPQLFYADTALELENVRSPGSLMYLSSLHPALSLMPGFSALQFNGIFNSRAINQEVDYLLNSHLVRADFSFKDQGYLRRANILEQRYNIELEQIVENPVAARKQAFNKQYQHQLNKCSQELQPYYADIAKACKAVLGTWASEEKGFRVNIKPENRVRLEDFSRLNGDERETKRFLERLSLKISTY